MASPFSQTMGTASTAMVFARLDPILKNLLEGLTSLKGIVPLLSNPRPNDQLESTFVRLSKSTVKELESLSKAMEQETSQEQQRLQHAKALCLLTKYITLPLNAIFRLPLREIFDPPKTSRSNNTAGNEPKHGGKVGAPNDPRLTIRRSYVYQLYRLAAVAMQRFIEKTTIKNNANGTKNNLLPITTCVEHLVALVHSMPTYSEIRNSNHTAANSSLDDGSNAYCAMLEATKTLLVCFETRTTTGNEENTTVLLLKEAWHGTLSMRLVDCLTAFLVCSPSEVFPPNVHRKALETLFKMLAVTNVKPIPNSNTNAVSQSQSFWRSVFPGVFTALYQIMTYDVTGKSKKSSSSETMVRIKTLSLRSLILLLRITLSTCTDFEASKEKDQNQDFASTTDNSPNSNDDLLAKLNSLILTANQKESNKSERAADIKDKKDWIEPNQNETEAIPGRNKEEQFFYEQVRKRVQSPLIFLLRQLSLSSTDAIRRDIGVLCKVILVETKDCWNTDAIADTTATSDTMESPENLMRQIPLEICIGFQQDPDAAVRSSAREIIDSFTSIQNAQLVDSPSVWMVSRVIELVQKLSALVHRGKTNTSTTKNGIMNINTTTIELRTDLNLLAGYLQCLDPSFHEGNGVTPKEMKAMNTSVCNAIVSSKHLRRGLIQLFDVDLDSLQSKSRSLVTPIFDHNSKSPIKLRHLDHPDFILLARDSILRSLGRLLGPKHGAIFVDELLSDFMEASFQMPKANAHSSSNDLFAGWLHEWVGSLIVAREILRGSFSFAATKVPSDKKEKRRRRILLSLASSILPLLVDCSLWNLPLDNRVASTMKISTDNSDTTLSLQTLQRNQIVVILLMELIGTFSQLLGADMKEVLVTIFYPIVEKTTRRGHNKNSDVVHQIGLSTLRTMSLSYGFDETEDLIHAEQNRLTSAMIGRLRLPGGSPIPNTRDEAEEIFSVTKTSIWLLEMINRKVETINSSGNREALDKDPALTKSSAVMDLIALLNYRLDHLFLQKVMTDADVETVCSLHKVFFDYFLHLFQVDKEKTYSYQMKNLEKDSKEPWLDLLSQFRKIPPHKYDSNGESKESEGNLLDFSKSDIELFAKLIGRDCYLLSYQKLESRISSCDALTIAFKVLAYVGSEHDDPTDDRNVIRNTILRQVADSWPSIRARLKSLSEVILQSYSSRGSNIVLVLNQNNREQKNQEDVGTQRIFLSKLFELIATMCECSGDFFADRFRNDVWPCMARHLEYLLQELQRQCEAHFSSDRVVPEPKLITTIGHPLLNRTSTGNELTPVEKNLSIKISETQEQLIVSILRCLNRILEQGECGKALEKLLGIIGSTILPLVDAEGQTKIQEISMDCIRSILKINSDVLRRPLMELSGTRIQACPLKFRRDLSRVEKVSCDLSLSVRDKDDAISHRCCELLSFADSLPEQVIS